MACHFLFDRLRKIVKVAVPFGFVNFNFADKNANGFVGRRDAIKQIVIYARRASGFAAENFPRRFQLNRRSALRQSEPPVRVFEKTQNALSVVFVVVRVGNNDVKLPFIRLSRAISACSGGNGIFAPKRRYSFFPSFDSTKSARSLSRFRNGK